MTFDEWFEADGREAVGASGLGASGQTVRGICQRAFEAGERQAAQGARDATAARSDWVARLYLLGVIPVGRVAVGRGGGRGAAWLDARLTVHRLLRPLVGIEVSDQAG